MPLPLRNLAQLRCTWLLLLCLCGSEPSHAQAVLFRVEPFTLNLGGGFYLNRGNIGVDNVSLAWSIGELALTETLTTPGGAIIITHGLLQPIADNDLKIFDVLGWRPEELKLYPNPVRDILQVDVFTRASGKLSLQTLDQFGRTLGYQEINYAAVPLNQRLPFAKWGSGVYYVRINLTEQGKLVKSGVFKIIKTQ